MAMRDCVRALNESYMSCGPLEQRHIVELDKVRSCHTISYMHCAYMRLCASFKLVSCVHALSLRQSTSPYRHELGHCCGAQLH